MKKAALYIHIPFCKVKCVYCDFYSITKKEDEIPVFTECLLKENHLSKLDFELEIAIVIAKEGINIDSKDADEYILGYINTTAAIDEISFKMDSGNMDGEIKMYGLL